MKFQKQKNIVIIMKSTFLTIIFSFLLLTPKIQAKKPFTIEDAMKFKTLQSPKISNDGNWLFYVLKPDRGDGNAYIQAINSDKKYTFPRGENAQLTDNSSFVVMSVKGKSVEIDNAKTDKDKPKQGMAILNLITGEIKNYEAIKNFKISNNGNWLAYTKDEEKKNESKDKDKDKSTSKIGENLILVNLPTFTEILIENVNENLFDSTSTRLFYARSTADGKQNGLYFRDLIANFAPEIKITLDSNYSYNNFTLHYKPYQFAFTSAKYDTTGKPGDCSLKIWDSNKNSLTTIIKDSLDKDWFVPSKNNLKWTKDGQRLIFGIKPQTEKTVEKDDKFKFKEDNYYDKDKITQKATLFLWNTKDDLIVPHQKKLWKEAKDQTYFAQYDLKTEKKSFLKTFSSNDVSYNENPEYILFSDKMPYLKEVTWNGSFSDLYSYNLKTEKKIKLASYLSEGHFLSPKGGKVVYYDKKHWFIVDINGNKTINITENLGSNFYNEKHDTPSEPGSCGFGGWGENDEFFLLYDNINIWKINTIDLSATNLTKSINNTGNIQFRIFDLDSDRDFYKKTDTLWLNGFDRKTKESGLFVLDLNSNSILNKIFDKKTYSFRQKAEYSDKYLITMQNFEEYPEISLTDKLLKSPQKLTNSNPEMKDMEWGTTELVNWITPKGDSLQGYIMKPENFDKNKKYPVVIYFYEQLSDNVYRWSQPIVSSRPCFQEYLSDGYIIFFPDIKYTIGSPGQSSLEALVSGSRHLASLGFVDSTKIGIWGHSWSGYQGSYIITQTDFFKCCVAGAPVGNMTSAYSGIRLGSGLARQFQYESEQSRIGGTFVDSLSRYIANSPVFFAQNVHTPLLIFFGDNDDAVPYSQGIELYLAFRRWGKECIMLQYEDEPHHPQKYWNKLDYNIKMKQYFDHYLKGKDAPEWWSKGLKYKGDYMLK